MSETAQAEEKRKSKRQLGAGPQPVTLFKSPAKEVRGLLETYPGIKVQCQKAQTSSSLSLTSTRRGSWGSDGSLQTAGGRISPGIEERIQTLEAASSTAVAGSGLRKQTSDTRGPTNGIGFIRRK